MLDQYSLKPSRILASLLVAALVLATASVGLADLTPQWRLALVALAWLGGLDALWRVALLRHATSWLSFSLSGRQLRVCRRAAGEMEGEVMPRTLVTSLCVVLWMKPQQGQPVAQVIFRDALPGDSFRDLCVNLKYR